MSTSPAERKQILARLAQMANGDLKALWKRAESLDSQAFRALLIEAFPTLIDPYSAAAAEIAATWYEDADPKSDYVAQPASLPAGAQLQASATWALNVGSGVDALGLMAGTMQRAIFTSARDTTVFNASREPRARWARHASANACDFCKMLATRHAVYTSEAAASTVVGRRAEITISDRRSIHAGLITRDEAYDRRARYSSSRAAGKAGKLVGSEKARPTRGNQSLGDKYHDHCHCIAVEVRPGDSYEPPDYVEKWDDEYDQARQLADKNEYGAVSLKDLMAAWRQLDHP